MDVVVLSETWPGERRVAAVPDTVRSLIEAGWRVHVEQGAGAGARISDEAFRDAGAALWSRSAADRSPPIARDPEADPGLPPVFVKVRSPRVPAPEGAGEGAGTPEGESELALLPPGALLVSFLDPHRSPGALDALAEARVTALSLERTPRTTRAQPMDALSSQATAAGYRAVTLGAGLLERFLPMLTTAAGTIPPARVLVLGAGVAGLQAIATARRLGAVVHAFDIRPVVKEQVESLGAHFLEADLEADAEAAGGYARELDESEQERNRRLVADTLPAIDLLVTTALVPGRPAPLLITDEMLAGMRPGSVVVDLAAEAGGNVQATVADEIVEREGIRIAGPTNPASDLAVDASRMFARNVVALLRHLVAGVGEEPEPGDEAELWPLDLSDPILDALCLTHGGRIRGQEAESHA